MNPKLKNSNLKKLLFALNAHLKIVLIINIVKFVKLLIHIMNNKILFKIKINLLQIKI